MPEPWARAVNQIDIDPTSFNLQSFERGTLKKKNLSFITIVTSMQKENRLKGHPI